MFRGAPRNRSGRLAISRGELRTRFHYAKEGCTYRLYRSSLVSHIYLQHLGAKRRKCNQSKITRNRSDSKSIASTVTTVPLAFHFAQRIRIEYIPKFVRELSVLEARLCLPFSSCTIAQIHFSDGMQGTQTYARCFHASRENWSNFSPFNFYFDVEVTVRRGLLSYQNFILCIVLHKQLTNFCLIRAFFPTNFTINFVN